MVLNQTITNFSLKKTEQLKTIEPNQTDNHGPLIMVQFFFFGFSLIDKPIQTQPWLIMHALFKV
jgi:hypothetical protein